MIVSHDILDRFLVVVAPCGTHALRIYPMTLVTAALFAVIPTTAAAAVSAAALAMLRVPRAAVWKGLALSSSAALRTLAATTAPAVVTMVSFAAAATVRLSIRGTQAFKLVRRPSAHHSAIRLNSCGGST